MSVVRTRHGQVEVRAAFGTEGAYVPAYGSQWGTASGVAVTTGTATGLPALGRAIRLVGGLIGAAAIGIYEGRRGDKRETPGAPQALLLDDPYPGMSVFDWRYDIAVSLEACENAFLRKIKTGRGKLVALEPIPHRLVNASVGRNGEKVFEISTAAGWKKAAAGEILHIRGQTVEGGPFGVSRITQHRDPLGSILAAQRFEGAFFKNYARPDMVMEFPQGVTIEQGRQWKTVWDSDHAGPDNAGKARAVGGGAQIKPIPVSMRDAQFIESKGLSVSEIAQIMDVEELLIGGGQSEQNDDQAMDRFLAFQLPPRLARIVAALKADPDLFPNGDPGYPEFVSNPLMFASPKTRADVQHKEIQAGTLLPDEARADNGRPPLPDGLGQIPQVTPVGGAPNPEPMPSQEPASRELELREATKAVPIPQPDPVALEILAELRALNRGTEQPIVVNVPEMRVPDVYVTVEPTPITIENRVDATEAHFDVHVPEQPAAVVHVTPTPIVVQEREQPAPVVNFGVPDVHVTVEPTPITVDAPVTVNVPEPPPAIVVTGDDPQPERAKKLTVKRHPTTGLIESVLVEERE